MKDITFVCQYLAKGGAERVMSILINYFALSKYKVRVIVLYENIIDYDIDPNVETIYLNWKRKPKISEYIKNLKELRVLLKNTIIISFLYTAIRDTVLATILLEKKLIVSERNDPYNDPPGKLRRLIRTISYLFADKIVFQTKDAMDYFPKIIRKKGVIIENPIKSNLPVKKSGYREKTVVSICRITAQKNIKLGIDAFSDFLKTHPEYIYNIYGDGELYDEIEQYIINKNLQNKVFLKGFIKNIHEEVINAMMYISSSNYEGISNSMLEAMALGLPVICTDCPIGGSRQVIKNGINGILTPVGDAVELTKAMLLIANDFKFRQTLSNNARSVNEKYKTSSICNMWEELVSE